MSMQTEDWFDKLGKQQQQVRKHVIWQPGLQEKAAAKKTCFAAGHFLFCHPKLMACVLFKTF
jgi:hypothetical protein